MKKEFYLSQSEDYNPGSRFSKSFWNCFGCWKPKAQSYVFETKNHTSKWHTVILHKVQGYIVQVSMYKEISRSSWPPKELGMNTIFQRSCSASVRRKKKKKKKCLQSSRHSHLWGGLINVQWRCTLHIRDKAGGARTYTQKTLCLVKI